VKEPEKGKERGGRYQIVWRWRSFLWPFYLCLCEDCGTKHLAFDGWPVAYFHHTTPEWGLYPIYSWFARLGPLEVRRWVPDEQMSQRILAHNSTVDGEAR